MTLCHTIELDVENYETSGKTERIDYHSDNAICNIEANMDNPLRLKPNWHFQTIHLDQDYSSSS